MHRHAEFCKFLRKQEVTTKKHKKRARENIKLEKREPEIKKKGAGHVQAADGEHHASHEVKVKGRLSRLIISIATNMFRHVAIAGAR